MRLLLLGLLALLCACRRASGPDDEHQPAIEYRPIATDAEPLAAAQVEVHETADALPAGIEVDSNELSLAPAYPSEDAPHRILGKIVVTERVDVSYLDKEKLEIALKSETLRARRAALVAAEAARHGANAAFRIGPGNRSGSHRMTERVLVYHALRLAPEPPRYPEVDALLARLELEGQGYRAVHRFTAKLEELAGRPPEKIRLERGRCYALAIAFHPGPVERPRREVTSIDFVHEVAAPVEFPGIPVNDATQGRFSPKLDGGGGDGKSWHVLDGIWSRVGVGTLECPVYRSQPAAIRFTTFTGSRLKDPPPLAAGRGTAELVLYEKKLTPAELAKRACARCYDESRACDRKKPWSACAPLVACTQVAGISAEACTPHYAE